MIKNTFDISEKQLDVLKIESKLLHGAFEYCYNNGFTYVTPPHITRATGACENIDTHFELDFFGQKAFLSQTGQLFLETFIKSIGNVFCISPSFRAEPSIDDRHLCEFTLIELEFPTEKDEDMDALINHIEGIFWKMMQNVYPEITKYVAHPPYNRIKYETACDLLEVPFGTDFKSKHEQKLCNGKPLFITHYPKEIKFFNMQPNTDNDKVVNSCDFILPIAGESAGAACRIWDYKQLKERLTNSEMMEQLRKKGVDEDVFDWYIEVVKKHGMPHAGFGMGLSRIVQYITGGQTVFPIRRNNLY